MSEKRFTHRFFLPASEVNAQRELPLPRLVTLIIDVATAHANSIGIGFDNMIRHGLSWVLSRLTIDITEMPSVGGNYEMKTWIENVNRMFSERNFELTDAETGRVMATVHSSWMAIDMHSRRPGNLSPVFEGLDIIDGTPYPGDKGARLCPLTTSVNESAYRFAVSDIDVNRHVTTRRYIDLIVDQWPLEYYDSHCLHRFEVAFKHEARYGEEARTICSPHDDSDGLTSDVQIEVDGTACCIARVCFGRRTHQTETEN